MQRSPATEKQWETNAVQKKIGNEANDNEIEELHLAFHEVQENLGNIFQW